MAFDDVCLGIEVKTPDALKEHGAGHDLADMAHKLFEQSELAGLEIDFAAIAPHFALQQIKRNCPDF